MRRLYHSILHPRDSDTLRRCHDCTHTVDVAMITRRAYEGAQTYLVFKDKADLRLIGAIIWHDDSHATIYFPDYSPSQLSGDIGPPSHERAQEHVARSLARLRGDPTSPINWRGP